MDVGDPPVPGTSNLITVDIQLLHQRIEHFQAGPDAVAEHERHAGSLPHVHSDPLTAGGDVASSPIVLTGV